MLFKHLILTMSFQKEIEVYFEFLILLFCIEASMSSITEVQKVGKEKKLYFPVLDKEKIRLQNIMMNDVKNKYNEKNLLLLNAADTGLKALDIDQKLEENSATKETSSSLMSKFNRYQWESIFNTFPSIPLNGYTKSDPTSLFVLHNASYLFSFIIATVPLLFSLLFLGVGSLVDLKDLPLIRYIVEEYL